VSKGLKEIKRRSPLILKKADKEKVKLGKGDAIRKKNVELIGESCRKNLVHKGVETATTALQRGKLGFFVKDRGCTDQMNGLVAGQNKRAPRVWERANEQTRTKKGKRIRHYPEKAPRENTIGWWPAKKKFFCCSKGPGNIGGGEY